MPYREVSMWEVLEVLRRRHRGESQRAIMAATGKARKTQRRYVKAALRLGWSPSVEPDEELASRVYQQVRPGPGGNAAEERDAVLLPHLEAIKSWLGAEGGEKEEEALTIVKIHDLLRRQGVEIPYIRLYRFIRKHCEPIRRRCTVRMPDTSPGEVAEVDFGRLGLVPHESEEGRRTLWALIVTLVYSRHQYVHVCSSQKYGDLLEGLEDAWEFFGGVPGRVIIDGMKAAIFKADRYDPVFQRTFEEYARYRGFEIDPTVPRTPTGKPHVEAGVKYVRKNFFRGEKWLNKAQVEREAVRWCVETAGQRTHGTTRRRPIQVFEEEERGALKPLEKDRYDPPRWAKCKVHPDHSIRLSHAIYTIPTKYVGKEVDVREDSRIVRVYCQGVLIKTHPRQQPGEKSIDHDDYPKELTAYTRRDPDRMIHVAGTIGEQAQAFVERLLAPPFPWKKLRQAQMLMGLARKFGNARINAACEHALIYDRINSYAVKEIVEKNLDGQTKGVQGRLFPAPARFLRPSKSFSHQA